MLLNLYPNLCDYDDEIYQQNFLSSAVQGIMMEKMSEDKNSLKINGHIT